MYVPLNCVIIDVDSANRQELAGFLGKFGVHVVNQFANADPLANLLNRSDAPQLVVVNLDPQRPGCSSENLAFAAAVSRRQLLPDVAIAGRKSAHGGDALRRERIHRPAHERGQTYRRHRTCRGKLWHGEKGQDHSRDSDHRRLRIDNSGLQCRSVARQNRRQDPAARSRSGARRSGWVFRRSAQVHDRGM